METITIGTATIRLGQLLKMAGAVETGGEAKIRIQAGEVKVNDAVETRRGRQLSAGDRVSLGGRVFLVQVPTE